ncbi:hypothetical protein OG218_20940 [Kineococcus sp. NBC_00420]|uniref:hypothetical protein n=1 Tax=Kineococcus sp. NBC_00420 TaxID=2903564 RepID=UPI002E21720B
MPASSLIFLVIIVLWAAYLVPGAIRKHRRVASARQADRDSQAMRVVVRRNSAPVGQALAAAAVNAAVLGASSRPVLGGAGSPALPAAPSVSSPAPSLVRAAPSAPSSRTVSAVVTRRRRLLGTVVGLTVLGWLTVLVGLAPWYSGALPTLGLLLVVAALSRHGAARSARPVVAPSRVSEVTQVLPVLRPSAPTVPVQREQKPSPLAGDRSWQPVPVPLPTYLLKDKAPFVAPPLPAVAVATEEWEDELATRVIDLRDHARVVNQ